jgi:hypothetical protein
MAGKPPKGRDKKLKVKKQSIRDLGPRKGASVKGGQIKRPPTKPIEPVG